MVLLVGIGGVFGPAAHYPFVNYDDELYVVDNPHVMAGVTAQGVRWAFTASYASNWHPLTWISHMVDCQLFGLASAGGHHLTSVAIHAITAVLLFLVLLRMTGHLWPSAGVASVFAIHPLHVESVVWVAERKDVLSGLFFVLTLAAYLRYVRRPLSIRRYLTVLGAYALGLLSKPMLVTVPFVLLLLDYWPLRRFSFAPLESAAGAPAQVTPTRTLLLEKIPLVALAAASSVITYAVQRGARGSLARVPLSSRLANAAVSYVGYLGKFVYPSGLAVFYPHPEGGLPGWKIAGACVLLFGISAVAFAWRRRHPYVLVGWLWYLGMLVPVIGLVQVGAQAMADRYTYLTQIGVYVAVAWGAVHLARSRPRRSRAVGVAAMVAILALSISAWQQVSFWRNSESLWTHALASTSGNYEAHNGLARALARRGQLDAAIAHYELALAIKPDFVDARDNLGNALADSGRVEAAIGQYRIALEIRPDHAPSHNNLGLALAENGQVDEAISHYRRALTLQPDFAEAHYNLGNAFANRRHADAAIEQYRAALAINPGFAEAHNNLGTLLAGRGQTAEAIAHLRKALAINPQFVSARNNLAAILGERKGP